MRWMLWSDILRWTERVARGEKREKSVKLTYENPKKRYRLEYRGMYRMIILKLNLFHLARDSERWRAIAKMVTNERVKAVP
jgi:hypothetical protein